MEKMVLELHLEKHEDLVVEGPTSGMAEIFQEDTMNSSWQRKWHVNAGLGNQVRRAHGAQSEHRPETIGTDRVLKSRRRRPAQDGENRLSLGKSNHKASRIPA